ncbi:MAG: tetratricopeptide repeat protein [Sphingomicrobium sp.]
MEDPITRTCSLLISTATAGMIALATLAPAAAAASTAATADPARTYIRARVAAMNGDHSSAAELLSALSSTRPGERDLKGQALGEAMGAGRMDLAIPAARAMPTNELASDARLLLVADAVKRGRLSDAKSLLAIKGATGDLLFLAPLVDAWGAAEGRDEAKAMASLNQIPANGLLTPFRDEQQALILLKFGRTAEAEPFARRAIGSAGPREMKVRLVLADAFLAARDKERAAIMLDGSGADGFVPRQLLLSGKSIGIRVDTLPEALSDVLAALAADVARRQRGMPPFGLIQVARYLDPANSSATALMAVLLETRDRSKEALTVLRAIPASDPLNSPVRDLEAQILIEEKDIAGAFRLAQAGAASPTAGPADHARLGNVLVAMERNGEAAQSFDRAIVLAERIGVRDEVWPLHLLRADALLKTERWDEVKSSLNAALAMSPDQPLILNYLGYAKLERGEDMDAAEAMIRKASELAPDDASIIDSLGWAQFKRGKVSEAIATLQEAAIKDPAQAEIHEHLGDALFTSGRRYEARFAWSAALITAEEHVARRIRAKLDHGLTEANAAP